MAAIEAINKDRDVPLKVRQVKYLNNIVEQDHRAIKRVTRLMFNFKSFYSVKSILAGMNSRTCSAKANSTLRGATRCLWLTNSMFWQDKSVQHK